LHFRNPGPVRNKTEYAVYNIDQFKPEPQLREKGEIELAPNGEYIKEFIHYAGADWSFKSRDLGAVDTCPK